MATTTLGTTLRHVQTLAAAQQARAGTDSELLHAFVRSQDQAAFTELVRRHGALVWGVCRHVLGHVQDAEDAFQATFLVLAHRAAFIRKTEAVAGFLHAVAYRTAMRGKRDAARRRKHERQVQAMTQRSAAGEATWREVQALLDAELQRLPPRLRDVFVLCAVEGHSRPEAARQLGLKEGTVSSRLAHARKQLQARLARQGITLTAVLAASVLAREAAPAAPLPTATTRAVLAALAPTTAGTVSARAALLAQGVLKAMMAHKLTARLLLLLALALAAAGSGFFRQTPATPANAQEQAQAATSAPAHPRSKPDADRPVARDRYGDPLPPGAVARLGTERLQHGGMAWAVAFSPDGKSLASTGNDGTVRIWDARTGKQRYRLGGGLAWFHAVAFTRDGKTLIAGGSDPNVRLWDVATGKEVLRLPGHDSWPQSLALSADGRTLAVSAGEALHLWDLSTHTELWKVKRPGVFASRIVVYSPDGKTIAASSSDASVRLYDAASGRETARLPIKADALEYGLAYSPDSKLLAIGGEDRAIHLWDTAAAKERSPLRGHTDRIGSLAFSPDGRMLVSGGMDETVRVWDPATGKEVRRFQAPADQYEGLAFSPDGRTLAAAGALGRVYLWDAATGKELPQSAAVSSAPWQVAFLPDGKTLLSWGGRIRASRVGADLIRWDAASGKELSRLKGRWDDIHSLTVAADGRTVAFATRKEDGAHVWDLATGKEQRRFPGFYFLVALTPDGRTLVTGGTGVGPALRFWDVATGKELRQVKEHPGSAIIRLVISPDGKTLVSRGLDTNVAKDPALHSWDLATGKERRELPFPPSGQLAFSPDSTILAVTGVQHRFLPGTREDIDAVHLLDVQTGKELRRFGTSKSLFGECARGFSALAFSPDGRTLATGQGEGTIRLWEVASGGERRLLHGHTGDIESLSFSPDGTRLASSGGDRTALVWDLAGRPSTRPLSPQELERCWADLAAADAARAYRTILALAARPEQAVAFLKERLRPSVPADPRRVAALLAGLDSEQFSERQQAVRELERLGLSAERPLREALRQNPSLEARRRINRLLEKLEGPQTLQLVRAIEILEMTRSPAAQQLLHQLARGEDGARLTREAKAAVRRMTR